MVFRLLFFLSSCALITACGAVSSSNAKADDTLRRYHDGQRWVEVRVMLDRLQLERVGNDGQVTAREAYVLRSPVRSLAELDAVAAQMTAAQHDLRAISAYVVSGENPGAQPMRVTHQVAVKSGNLIQVEAYLIQHGGRIVDRPAYDPSLLICETEAGGLLASFTLADGLRQLPDVTLAMPLIERAHLNHVPPGFR
jgi:hypothetical protein